FIVYDNTATGGQVRVQALQAPTHRAQQGPSQNVAGPVRGPTSTLRCPADVPGSLWCPLCGAVFTNRVSKSHHMADHRAPGGKVSFTCPQCDQTFTRKSNLTRHLKKHC